MAVALKVMATLAVLMQGCLCSSVDTGCRQWKKRGGDMCCDACYPGHHLVQECGLSPKNLCTPCEPGTYTVNPKVFKCEPCTECVGALTLLTECTATKDTTCRCKDGLTCGDSVCSFCVERCDKGQEPTTDRSCRPCPNGTFNDQIHQKCKPWKTSCPYPDEYIEIQGDAFSDMKCTKITPSPVHKNNNPGQAWSLVLFIVITVVLSAFCCVVIVIFSVTVKKLQKKRKAHNPATNAPIFKPQPSSSDDPRTLIAVECSFHEAQQEQGGSSESVDSTDSSQQLMP